MSAMGLDCFGTEMKRFGDGLYFLALTDSLQNLEGLPWSGGIDQFLVELQRASGALAS